MQYWGLPSFEWDDFGSSSKCRAIVSTGATGAVALVHFEGTITKNSTKNEKYTLEWVNNRFLAYFLWFSVEIDGFPHELRKFIKKIEKNMSKNVARAKLKIYLG